MARRANPRLRQARDASEVLIEDRISFSDGRQSVEEAFVMWSQPEIDGSTARIPGERHDVELTIEEPSGAVWVVETFEEESAANNKKGVLKRLTFSAADGTSVETRVRARITSRKSDSQ